MQKTELDIPLDLPEHAAEIALWADVLDLLISDARAFWLGKGYRGSTLEERENAFNDVLSCGPMLRHCCGFLDLDAQWISQGFIQWCDDMA